MEFCVGDRVVCVVDHPAFSRYLVKGDTGTVCGILGTSTMVCWDKEIEDGHDCGGKCESGHGWIVNAREIELEEGYDEPFEFDESAFQELLFPR